PGVVEGVEISSPVLYETVARAFDLYVTQRSDVVAVASPSAAEALKDVPMLPRAAALGPTTAGGVWEVGGGRWVGSGGGGGWGVGEGDCGEGEQVIGIVGAARRVRIP